MIPRPDTRALGGELAGLLERAQPLALMPNHVCVDRLEVERIVARLGVQAEQAGFGRTGVDADEAVLRAARAVEKAVRRGYQVPFTGQVRLTRRRAAALAAALRASLDGRGV